MMERMTGIFLGLALLLSSCTEQEHFALSDEIRLEMNPGSYSRASVDNGDSLSSIGNQIGVYGVVTSQSDPLFPLGADWTLNPLMNNVRTTSVDLDGTIHWDKSYSYPHSREGEADKYVRFCAYHPYADAASSGAWYVEAVSGHSPVLHFSLTGSEDLMCASPVSGSAKAGAKALEFRHLLTQLRFQFVDDAHILAAGQITRITVDGVNIASTLNIETGELGVWKESVSAFPFKTDYPFPVSGTEQAPQAIPGAMMLQPGKASFRMSVHTDSSLGNFRNIEIKPDDGDTAFLAGKSYLITLKFRDRAVVLQTAVKVQPWVEGPSGSVDIN